MFYGTVFEDFVYRCLVNGRFRGKLHDVQRNIGKLIANGPYLEEVKEKKYTFIIILFRIPMVQADELQDGSMPIFDTDPPFFLDKIDCFPDFHV